MPDFNTSPEAIYQNEAMRRVLQLGLLGVGGGLAGRALVGVPNFLKRNVTSPPKAPIRESLINIPVPVHPEKRAADPIADIAQNLTHFTGINPAQGQSHDWLGRLATGWGQKNITDMPWATAGAIAAPAAGMYGGWKLADKLLDWSRDREQQSELDTAKQRYEKALLSNYGKTASADDKPDPLDSLADRYEKQAYVPWAPMIGGLAGMGLGHVAGGVAGELGMNPPSSPYSNLPLLGAAAGGVGGIQYDINRMRGAGRNQRTELLAKGNHTPQEKRDLDVLEDLHRGGDLGKEATLTGLLGGAGLIGAGGLALGSGIGTYNWARNWSESGALEDALRRRQEQLYAQNPRPILASPVPVMPEEKHQSIQDRIAGIKMPNMPDLSQFGFGGAAKPKSKSKPRTKAAASAQQPLAQAADAFTNKYKGQQAAFWKQTQTMLNGGKPLGGEQKPAPPMAPRPPSLVSRPPQPLR